jgi:DNA-binding MarR family transcriptional regulator
MSTMLRVSDQAVGHVHSPMLLLPRLAKQILRRGNEELLGMPPKLMLALSYLEDRGDTPQQELADALGMDANMVVLLLNELEDQGYVERRRDPEDRRRHRVQTTHKGQVALARTEPARRAIEEEILGALSADERVTLASLLSRAVYGLEHVSEDGRP